MNNCKSGFHQRTTNSFLFFNKICIFFFYFLGSNKFWWKLISIVGPNFVILFFSFFGFRSFSNTAVLAMKAGHIYLHFFHIL